MKLQFDSVAELIAMGGHGIYVWAVYGVAAGLMIWMVCRPLRRRAHILAAVRAARRREGAR